MRRSFLIDGRLRGAGLGGALLMLVASCAEFATVADVVFPSFVPGLPADQPWTSLPVRRWLTEGTIEPVAISACLSCEEAAAAGLFQARGREAVALRRAASDPAAALQALMRPHPTRHRPLRKPLSPARVAAEPASEGGVPGVVIRLSRQDGSREAAGYIAALQQAGGTQVIVIVAESEATVRALARGIVLRLGG